MKQIAIRVLDIVRIATVIATVLLIGFFCLSIALYGLDALREFING